MRHRARHPARGDDLERRHLRHRSGVRGAAAAHARAPVARGADLRAADARRAAQGHPVVPHRVDRPERGGAWTEYLAKTRDDTADLVGRIFADEEPEPADDGELARLGSRRRGQGAGRHLLPAHRPARRAAARPRAPASGRRSGRARARRTSATGATVVTSPGRASSAPAYRFDVLGDYGAFRDLQRHRMLTIEWQRLSPRHGYEVPPQLIDAHQGARFDDAMERSAALHDVLVDRFPEQAAYASLTRVPNALRDPDERTRGDASFRVAQLTARSSELPADRAVDAPAHSASSAGHRTIAAAMIYVDHGESDLERLDADVPRKRAT